MIDHARRLGIGRLALRLYHRPLNRLRASLRNGGPLAERATERQRRQMEEAAATFGPLPAPPETAPVTVHLMTGRRFWYQTVFCLQTFARTTQRPLRVELYDDGTINREVERRLLQMGDSVRIHRWADLRSQLDAHLPASRFPVLRERWENYPNIRKLIDVHLGSTGWKVVLDSDLLFFRRPDAMLDWIAAPTGILHAIDSTESYGYSRSLLEALAGAPLPIRLNVGVCGLRSDVLDWELLEAWTAELQRREKTNYYLEQALVAMLAAREPATALPANDYVTQPSRAEVQAPRAVMHHYVDTAKRWYFRHGWRRAVDSVDPSGKR